MPAISDNLRFVFWICAGIAGAIFAILGIALNSNIVYLVRRILRKPKGRRPSEMPLLIWLGVISACFFMILCSSIASSAPEKYPPASTSTFTKEIFSTETYQPLSSPSPTNTMIPTSIATSSPVVLFDPEAPDFSSIFEKYPDLAARLGTTIMPYPILEGDGAYQEFETGILIFRGRATRETSIYGFSCNNSDITKLVVTAPPCIDGKYSVYPNEWRWGINPRVPEELTPKPSFFQPVNGFGLVWYKNPEIRDSFGWGTMCEISTTLYVQTFYDGLLIYISDFIHFSYGDLPCSELDRYQHKGKLFALYFSPSGSNAGKWVYISDYVLSSVTP